MYQAYRAWREEKRSELAISYTTVGCLIPVKTGGSFVKNYTLVASDSTPKVNEMAQQRGKRPHTVAIDRLEQLRDDSNMRPRTISGSDLVGMDEMCNQAEALQILKKSLDQELEAEIADAHVFVVMGASVSILLNL